jgi:hypothetical protein
LTTSSDAINDTENMACWTIPRWSAEEVFSEHRILCKALIFQEISTTITSSHGTPCRVANKYRLDQAHERDKLCAEAEILQIADSCQLSINSTQKIQTPDLGRTLSRDALKTRGIQKIRQGHKFSQTLSQCRTKEKTLKPGYFERPSLSDSS